MELSGKRFVILVDTQFNDHEFWYPYFRLKEAGAAVTVVASSAGKTYEAHFYPGTNHGFHNDSTPRYDEAAAKLAWERTIAWFQRYLG